MKSSVLICDDSNLARKQVLRSLPEKWEVDVQLATNGLEALEVLRNNRIDVLFLDLTMPELDGIGVLEGIKDENITVDVFVISADIQPEMQNKVMELGAKAFLRKPVKADLLVSTLQDHGMM
ncbi:response regulator [Thalassotalea euphylliae]|uniref:response regulator n=1 Tax=Thalassotalea euphylliae TaxID=1655234 RepID=UPI00362905E8